MKRTTIAILIGSALLLAVVAGAAIATAASKDQAEGAAVDAEVLRWQREKRFFAAETTRIRTEIDALKKQRPRDGAAQRRHHHKWIQLTVAYFEAMADHYNSHDRYLGYALERYHDGVDALGRAIEQTAKSDGELRGGMTEVREQKQRALRFALLADEINTVLREPVANIGAYEHMLDIADQNLAGFAEILDGLARSQRRWQMDKVSLEAEIGRIEVARELAATLENLYQGSATAYRGIEEIDSVDVLDDLNIDGLLGSIEHPPARLRPELPPTMGIVPEAVRVRRGFDWSDSAREYEGKDDKVPAGLGPRAEAR